MCGRVMSQTIPKRAKRHNNISNRVSMASNDDDNTVNEDDGGNNNSGRRGNRRKPEFVVTPALCLAINNIDFVLEFIRPFVIELGLEDIFERLEALSGRVILNLISSCGPIITYLPYIAGCFPIVSANDQNSGPECHRECGEQDIGSAGDDRRKSRIHYYKFITIFSKIYLLCFFTRWRLLFKSFSLRVAPWLHTLEETRNHSFR